MTKEEFNTKLSETLMGVIEQFGNMHAAIATAQAQLAQFVMLLADYDQVVNEAD